MLEQLLLALQAFQVLFLWFHDWIPLGRLNDVTAVRHQDTPSRPVLVTLIQSVRSRSGSSTARVTCTSPIRTGSICGFGSLTACFSLAKCAPGGFPIFSSPNQRERSAIAKCSVTLTHFFRVAMASSPTQHTSCCTWLQHARCSVSC